MLAVLGLASLATPISAQEDSAYRTALVEAQRELVVELEGLAAWCKRQKLGREADVCYRQILQFDEDHKLARRTLRYSRRRGQWVQAASYRRPRNFAKLALVEHAERRLATLEPYKETVFALNARHRSSVSLEQRERSLLQLLELSPEDPEVRRALGEAWVDDKWMLVESESTFERRELIPELAKRCVATAPTGEPAEPNGLEKMLELPWSLVLETPYVRVAGTGDPEEVRHVMQVTQGAGEFFRTLLANDTLPPVGFAVYLLSSDSEKRQFLDKHPRVKLADRPFLEAVESAGIPKTSQTAEWSATEELRLDRSTRQTIGKMLADTYGITTDHGWAWEGIGIYLTYQLIGSRRTYYLRPDRYGDDPNATEEQRQLFRRLFHPEADWMNEAHAFFAEHRSPKLAILMGRKVDSMNAQDLLWSYVVGAYLIEGAPDRTPRFLRAIGAGRLPPHEAVRLAFDMELPRFEDRVRRWLDETR